jgi:hypothetical protein
MEIFPKWKTATLANCFQHDLYFGDPPAAHDAGRERLQNGIWRWASVKRIPRDEAPR